MTVQLIHGDCLEVMPTLPDASVDAIIADLPYGITACSWDVVIPFDLLWTQYKRLIKPRGVVVLFGTQPFSSLLVTSNLSWYKYDWIWEKSCPTGFLDALSKPLKAHENIHVFYGETPEYNPQKWQGTPNHSKRPNPVQNISSIYGGTRYAPATDESGMKYPRSVLRFNKHSAVENLHPSQKPVSLIEYLIRTYTNAGATVLDNTMGSGTAGVACANTGRNFVGIELYQKYFDIAQKRIEAAQAQQRMFT